MERSDKINLYKESTAHLRCIVSAACSLSLVYNLLLRTLAPLTALHCEHKHCAYAVPFRVVRFIFICTYHIMDVPA